MQRQTSVRSRIFFFNLHSTNTNLIEILMYNNNKTGQWTYVFPRKKTLFRAVHFSASQMAKAERLSVVSLYQHVLKCIDVMFVAVKGHIYFHQVFCISLSHQD